MFFLFTFFQFCLVVLSFTVFCLIPTDKQYRWFSFGIFMLSLFTFSFDIAQSYNGYFLQTPKIYLIVNFILLSFAILLLVYILKVPKVNESDESQTVKKNTLVSITSVMIGLISISILLTFSEIHTFTVMTTTSDDSTKKIEVCSDKDRVLENKMPVKPDNWFYNWFGQTLGGNFNEQEKQELLNNGALVNWLDIKINKLRFHDTNRMDLIYDFHTHVFGVDYWNILEKNEVQNDNEKEQPNDIQMKPINEPLDNELKNASFTSRVFFDGSLKKKITGSIYMSSGGVNKLNSADDDYINRLKLLNNEINSLFQKNISTKKFEYKNVLLAFDKHYSECRNRGDGETEMKPDYNNTEFFTSNETIKELTKDYPNFIPCGSIHPYRRDINMKEEINKLAIAGVKIIKWLPNAQGIDPDSDLCIPFYKAMLSNQMILICHCGEEKAVEAEEDQKLGNPLRLLKPILMGIPVIIAHCASLGYNYDYVFTNKIQPNFEIFMNMMKALRLSESEERKTLFKYLELNKELYLTDDYENNTYHIYGDISAIILTSRLSYLGPLIAADWMHKYLVYGSDYPLVGANILTSTLALQIRNFITSEDRTHLNELYKINPLLYDLVLKICLKFDPSVFFVPITLYDEYLSTRPNKVLLDKSPMTNARQSEQQLLDASSINIQYSEQNKIPNIMPNSMSNTMPDQMSNSMSE